MILLGACNAMTAEDFRVTKLPGLTAELSFKHYSGFMPLGDEAGTHLFFWFVESQSSPTEDPVLYWTVGICIILCSLSLKYSEWWTWF